MANRQLNFLIGQLEKYFTENGYNLLESWNLAAGDKSSGLPPEFLALVDRLKEIGITANNFDDRRTEIIKILEDNATPNP
jgi:hypothetical protein